MSDVLKTVAYEKFKDDIHVFNSHSLTYIRRENTKAKEIHLTLEITNRTLKEWNNIKKNVNCSFIDILNAFLAKDDFAYLIG